MEKTLLLQSEEIKGLLPYGEKERIPFHRMEFLSGPSGANASWLVTEDTCKDHFLGILPGHILLEASAQAAVCYAKTMYPELKDKYPLLRDFDGHLSTIVMAGDELRFFVSDFYTTSLHHGSVNAEVYLNDVEAGSFKIWFKIFSEKSFKRLLVKKKKEVELNAA